MGLGSLWGGLQGGLCKGTTHVGNTVSPCEAVQGLMAHMPRFRALSRNNFVTLYKHQLGTHVATSSSGVADVVQRAYRSAGLV